MISELIHKINEFEHISIALSEINLEDIPKKRQSIGEIQKKYGEFTPLALEQWKLSKKAHQKVPHFAKSGCLFLQRALEQASSEQVAQWKANRFKANRIISLTGGLGVDEWAWAKNGIQVVSSDIQPDLNALVRFNQQKLGIHYSRLDIDAEGLLSQTKATEGDLIYIDPDRRSENRRLGGHWESYQPHVGKLLTAFQQDYPQWLIKLSPMTDCTVLRKALPGKIHFFSVFYQQEVKELLLYLEPQCAPSEAYTSVVIDLEGVHETTQEQLELFVLTDSPEKEKRILFEPHGGLNLLNLNRILAKKIGLDSINQNNTLFLSVQSLPTTWGRSKEIVDAFEGSLNQTKKWLKAHGITGASVTPRSAKGMNGKQLQEKLAIQENSKWHLFITFDSGVFKSWLCN